jgi:uncharacterized RDD family membrane protein YckC
MSDPHGGHPEPTYGAPYPAPPAAPAPAWPAQPAPGTAAPPAWPTHDAHPGTAVQPAWRQHPVPGGAVQPYHPHSPAGHPAAFSPAPAWDFPLVSAGGRLGAALLDVLLMLVTLWVGWFVWAMITWADGQSPAKKLLGHVVADAETGQPFDWGRMALREWAVKGLLGWVLNIVTLTVYTWVDCFTVFGDRQRTLHDRMSGSIVRHV